MRDHKGFMEIAKVSVLGIKCVIGLYLKSPTNANNKAILIYGYVK